MRLSFSLSLIIIIAINVNLSAQKNIIYENLPIGKYAVGFKVITIVDDSRVAKPEYNYLGMKNEGDRRRRITIQLWYPSKANSGKRKLAYGDYCYNNLFKTSDEVIDTNQKNQQFVTFRRSVEGWFGRTTDEAWDKLIRYPMLAEMEAEPVNEKFPLLIGMLRPLSTSVINELLASNGYVVAMINSEGSSSFSESALENIPDMQFVISYLSKNENINDDIGSFGFSGSGFSQVLFAMSDYRVKALADIESGIYMEGLFQALSASNYYNPAKLRVPFLHIFSHDLSLQEKYIDEFEKKAKFAKRYRLILNQPKLHHWDFAAEGYTSCIFLNNRGTAGNNTRQSFEIASTYLLNFFNSELKKDSLSSHFLLDKSSLQKNSPSLWDITVYDPIKPAPDRDDFEYIIRKKGIKEALEIMTDALKNDSSSNIMQWYVLNRLGYKFLNEGKYEEAIGIFKLNTELHPDDANLFDSLAEGYERSGDKENMKKTTSIIIDILNKKPTLTGAEKNLKQNAEKRLNQ